ncbi:MAG: FHA domain-containing protein [Anaerolineaceae bacterium]|nr:FHA domain-containing protein [Anaerolineaceae bacterium]
MNALLLFILRLLVVLLLYLFIGWIGYTIFMDLRKSTEKNRKAYVSPITLIPLGEDLVEPKQYAQPEIIIGRDPANICHLEDSTVSLRHLKLFYRNQHWWAEDLESTNGSYLNGDPLLSPVILTDGDELQLGQVKVTVNLN